MRKRFLLASIIVIICSLVLGSLYLYFMNLTTINSDDIIYYIKQNATLEEVAKKLQEKNIIKSQACLYILCQDKGVKGKCKRWEFCNKTQNKTK